MKGIEALWVFLGDIGAAIFGAFMVVFDELYTLALFCRTDWSHGYIYENTCKYPYPWTAPLDPYSAFVQAFAWICIGVAMMGLSLYHLGKTSK